MRRYEDQFGGDQEGAVGKQCGDHHTWMEIVHVVAEDVALQTTEAALFRARGWKKGWRHSTLVIASL